MGAEHDEGIKKHMVDKYKELFGIYLMICKELYNNEKPYDNLEECCTTCERYHTKLSGMVELLRYSETISEEESEKEQEKIRETFSTHELFNAYMDNGEVWVYRKAGYQ